MEKRLAILSDLHIGNEHCVIGLIKENIAKCLEDKIDEVWLGGDLIEYVTKRSVGKQTMPTNDQLDLIIELLEPIKHKITKIIYGNHEQRAMRTYNIDPTRTIAAELGLKDKYVGSNKDTGEIWGFKYYIEHPLKGSGVQPSSYDLLNRKLMRNHNAELFIIPHFHTLFADIIYQLDTDKHTRIPHYFIYGGGYVDYWNSFGHDIHARPQILGSRVIVFDLDHHIIGVEML